MITKEQLRQEIEVVVGRYAAQCLNNENVTLVPELLALIEREKRKAAEDVLTRLRVPDLIDEWGAIDRALDHMFPHTPHDGN